MENVVTIRQFAGKICGISSIVDISEVMSRGLVAGWLSPEDVRLADSPAIRRDVARIVHDYLERECREQDENDWMQARKLKDLFDCRTCVNNIAQVYVKGIMKSKKVKESDPSCSDEMFDVNGCLTEAEATEIVRRMFDKSLREPQIDNTGESAGVVPTALTRSQAERLLKHDRRTMLIDVRDPEVFDREHLRGALNITVEEVTKMPSLLGTDKSKPIIFYCDKGKKSRIAADVAAKEGFTELFYLGIHQ